jgi:hypothetical protein
MSDFCQRLSIWSFGNMNLQFVPICVLLNMLSVIGLLGSQEMRSNNFMKYVLAESISDTIFTSSNIFFYFYGICTQCFLKTTYNMCVYSVDLVSALYSSASLLSQLCKVAANFERIKIITQRYKFLNKVPFYVKISLMVLVSLLSYVYQYWAVECYPNTVNNTIVNNSFSPIGSSFTNSRTYYYLNITTKSIRDVILCFVILILNIIIIILMRRSVLTKRNLNVQTSQIKTAEKAQTRLNQLVLVSNSITFIGHFPLFASTYVNVECFGAITWILLFVSYSSNFFLLIFFNMQFRLFFEKIIFTILKIFSFNYIQTKNEKMSRSSNTQNSGNSSRHKNSTGNKTFTTTKSSSN